MQQLQQYRTAKTVLFFLLRARRDRAVTKQTDDVKSLGLECRLKTPTCRSGLFGLTYATREYADPKDLRSDSQVRVSDARRLPSSIED